jgi:hypothetical protein
VALDAPEDAGSEEAAVEGVPAESNAARPVPVEDATLVTLMPVFPKQVSRSRQAKQTG